MTEPSQPSIAESMGVLHFLPTGEESMAVCTTEAQVHHMKAKDDFLHDWMGYQESVQDTDWTAVETFVTLLAQGDIKDEQSYKRVYREATRQVKIVPAKPLMIAAYYRLIAKGVTQKKPALEKFMLKKSVRSNSGVVVITVVTAPGPFSCPQDCHYCPNEPGQPRSYLSTEPAVARANQNKFDPARQIYDRAATLAKQGHEIDKLEIIVLGGTWSGYPWEYQEAFCRDIFYAANTFNEELAKARMEAEVAASDDMPPVAVQLSPALNMKLRNRLSLAEEQELNETAACKVIGLTLETRPDHISIPEIRRLRLLGCTRVQIGVQHTDDEILKFINRGHTVADAVAAVALLKQHCFKVDIHLMPDLPGSTLEKDLEMFDFVLNTEHLQADHWKVYPCEVTPFTKIEQWYAEGSYMPYTERDPRLLLSLLTKVKSQVHPWIRLNRVIRDIPKESIIAGNANTNLRQEVYKELAALQLACRCIRCREVRDWPERANTVMVRRDYRSSGGDEIFLSIEGTGDRGVGGGSEIRGLQEKSASRKADGSTPRLADNAPLYALLRLRFNDSPEMGNGFKELDGCALIRELHVYGTVVAARPEEGASADTLLPQHFGFGKRLMAEAERLAIQRGFKKIAVISGIGVRNYYRKRGYKLDGMFMVKELVPEASVEPIVASPIACQPASCTACPRKCSKKPGNFSASKIAITIAAAAAAVAVGFAWLRRRK